MTDGSVEEEPHPSGVGETLRRAAAHWSGQVMKPGPVVRTRWWQSPTVCAHINRRVCGEALPRLGAGNVELVRRKYPGRTFARGISVGCGTAPLETLLVEAGIVGHFDLFEIAEARIEQGRDLAARRGLAERLTFHQADAFAVAEPGSYDLVNWFDSLHHMLDVVKAVAWSRDMLVSGGVFLMDEFVGPTFMQFSERQLDLSDAVRAALGARYLADHANPGQRLSTRYRNPEIAALKRIDPTECADSTRILPAVRLIFPDCEVIETGGIVYHIALSDVLANIDEESDADMSVLRLMLLADDLCIAAGESLRAVALAEKPSGIG